MDQTRGYFTLAFLDIFESIGGYGYSYGINYVDLDDPDLKRYPKLSAKWYSNFLKGRSINLDGVIELEKNPLSLSHSHFQLALFILWDKCSGVMLLMRTKMYKVTLLINNLQQGSQVFSFSALTFAY